METPLRPRPLLRLPLVPHLVLGLLLGACSSENNPAAPGPAPKPDPGPDPAPTLYNVSIVFLNVEVLGTCEGDPSNPGEFEYEVTGWGRNFSDTYVKHYQLLGSFTGDDGEIYRLVDHHTSFRVPAGKNYYVGFKATDTDPWPNEDEYVGYAQEVNKAGGQLVYDHRLQIGDNSCGLALYFHVVETPLD